MDPLVAALLGALVVMGMFFGLARLATGSHDYKARLARFAGEGAGEASDDKKQEKKSFNLGLGETEIAAKVEKSMGQQGFGRKVQRKLAQADLKLTLFEYTLVKVFASLFGVLVGLYLGRGGAVQAVLFGVGGLVLGFFVPDWYVKFTISKRIKAFNSQLGDTIGLLANSLRSGYSLLQSMELVAKESPDPIGAEFKRVVREVGLGISAQDALNNLLRRMTSDDLDLLITAINIQYEVGGNLAQILDTISHTIRERVRIKGEIGVLTAQGRISGYLISVLPIVIGIVVTLINPEYMNAMWEFPWLIMPICGGILLFIGFMVIRKIVNIEV
ncbi:MAG TPA: type II secretion system F family protein [Chloroflexia bacterium]|nr:type II secretion system F family protein [Chloroflexia bacterium]